MNRQKLFFRKIIYVVAIAILIYPLYLLGNPAQRRSDGFSKGGALAQMRSDSGLAEANLGEIDPAGSAMKLATFGMRGVAISLLWNRSQQYEMRSDWDNVVATANQIITLEPHFITIWDFVGWKLAYNASAQFDDYRERYRWVIRGFEFVQRGTVCNENSPKLFTRAGWTISQKIGIADEKKQYRRLFREDEEFADRQAEQLINMPNQKLDNWLLGYLFYKHAEDLFVELNDGIGKETRLLFFGRAPLNRIRYAEWVSIDGAGLNTTNEPIFDEERCAAAWSVAQQDWAAYSSRVVETTIEDKKNPGKYRKTSLDIQKERKAQIKELESWIESRLPEGVTRESIVWDRWNGELDEKMRAGLYSSILYPFAETNYNLAEVGFGARSVRKYLDGEFGPQAGWENWKDDLYEARIALIDEEFQALARRPRVLVASTDQKDYDSAFTRLEDWNAKGTTLLRLTPEILADRIENPDDRAEANDKCQEIAKLREEESFSRMFRDIMGADYHEREVAFEQTPEAREARRARQAARDRFQEAQPEEASREFLASMDSWVALLNRSDFADLRYLPQMQTDLMEEMDKYIIVLDQLERVFPKEYSFQEIVRREQSVVERQRRVDEGIAFIDQEITDGNFKEAAADAETLLQSWSKFNADYPYFELAPLPEITEQVFKSARQFATAWENLSEAERELARQSGKFSDYPMKNYLELVLTKSDDSYLEIQRLEMERLTDPEKSFEYLEQEVALWEKVVERVPLLKFDSTSEISLAIQNTVQEYLTELKKRDRAEPESFPLRDFAEIADPRQL